MMITKLFEREKKTRKKKSAMRPTGGTVTVKGLIIISIYLSIYLSIYNYFFVINDPKTGYIFL